MKEAERLHRLASAVYAEGIGKENALLYLDVHDALLSAAAALEEMEKVPCDCKFKHDICYCDGTRQVGG